MPGNSSALGPAETACPSNPCILTLNAGSSSIRFALFNEHLQRGLCGKMERIGLPDSMLTFRQGMAENKTHEKILAPNGLAAATCLVDWLERKAGFQRIRAIGHRVVHGGPGYFEPHLVTPELLSELQRLGPYDPEHMPAEVQLMQSLRKRFPAISQLACFDTGFHRDMPRVAQLLPIPRRFDACGVRRFGFHGLSYSFLLDQVRLLCGETVAQGRLILAHLGNGASMAAVRSGKSIDTSMAFTPVAGLPMSTRSGDLDPGLAWFLAQSEHLSPEQFHRMVNRESGLLGISETSSDMRDLLAREQDDVRAAEAVALFCYQAKKCIGSYAAALGGLDLLVFSGGIGENSWQVRERICDGLKFLGIEIDEARNRVSAPVISVEGSQTPVRVIETDEELTIARAVSQLLGA